MPQCLLTVEPGPDNDDNGQRGAQGNQQTTNSTAAGTREHQGQQRAGQLQCSAVTSNDMQWCTGAECRGEHERVCAQYTIVVYTRMQNPQPSPMQRALLSSIQYCNTKLLAKWCNRCCRCRSHNTLRYKPIGPKSHVKQRTAVLLSRTIVVTKWKMSVLGAVACNDDSGVVEWRNHCCMC